MTPQQLAVKVSLNSWKLVVERAGKKFSALTEDGLLQQVAPGKNRLIYIWGHLTAIHDAMFPILGLGPRMHPELDDIFVANPDKARQLPSASELKKYWHEVNGKLLSQFESLTPDEWLLQHHAMSDEDFAKDPTRNRLAVLLSRTSHASYHLGQAMLAAK